MEHVRTRNFPHEDDKEPAESGCCSRRVEDSAIEEEERPQGSSALIPDAERVIMRRIPERAPSQKLNGIFSKAIMKNRQYLDTTLLQFLNAQNINRTEHHRFYTAFVMQFSAGTRWKDTHCHCVVSLRHFTLHGGAAQLRTK